MMLELNALFETQVSIITSSMVRDNDFGLDASAYRLDDSHNTDT